MCALTGGDNNNDLSLVQELSLKNEELEQKIAEALMKLAETEHALAIASDEIARLEKYLNTPQDGDFVEAVIAEAAHQRKRWPNDMDKAPVDWGGVAAFLSQKAVQAALNNNLTKARHHCVSTAALMMNWYAKIPQDTPKEETRKPNGPITRVFP